MTIATNPAGVPLTDADIQRIVNDGVKAGELSWIGFDKDALGFYTIPVLSKCHFQLAHLVARAALAQPAAALAVPDGWRLAPVKPTDKMREAAAKADDEGFEAGRSHGASGEEIYAAMLAAAPEAPAQPAAAPLSDAVQLVVNVVKDASPMLRTSGYTKSADLLDMAVDGLAKQDAVHDQLAGAQFAAKQHLATVQAQAERIAALEAKCDLLAASLKQADGLRDQLVAALDRMVTRIDYYASLHDDVRPNIEQWAYTEASTDMAVARAALTAAREAP